MESTISISTGARKDEEELVWFLFYWPLLASARLAFGVYYSLFISMGFCFFKAPQLYSPWGFFVFGLVYEKHQFLVLEYD